ncbi:hypothetical protein DSO57_1023876 [Entomophthora muscae]|uniref:Uncharacterized protein n=1 Tax=Entomophthora muscae TaxID=34485 RepID=A0ACC2TPL4_9FUNG|nr:hypothetical protein DSO57_1023876 [Entomophthora muscae]
MHLKKEAQDNFKGHLEQFRLPALKLRDVNGGQRVVIGIKYSAVAPTFLPLTSFKDCRFLPSHIL